MAIERAQAHTWQPPISQGPEGTGVWGSCRAAAYVREQAEQSLVEQLVPKAADERLDERVLRPGRPSVSGRVARGGRA